MDIGAKGLSEVNLTIPQNTSLTFTIVHTDSEGNVIDHSESIANMAFQSKDRKTFVDLDSCVTCSATEITVSIPPSATANLPIGKLNWDLIITTIVDQIRLCYGIVNIIDTYAMDE